MQCKKLATSALALSCALSLGLSLTGCQSTEETPAASKQVAQQAPTSSPSVAKPETTQPASATLDVGTKEEALKALGLSSAPKAVVPISWTDATYLLAAGAPIVGLPDNHHLPEESLQKYTMISDHDGKLDLEALKQAKPDLILVNEKTLEKQTELHHFLEENHIAHHAFPSAKTVSDVWKLVAQTGTAMGTEETMHKNLDALLKRVDVAKDSLKDLKNRKVAILNVTAEGRSLFNGNNITASVLEELGLENIAKSMKFSAEPDASGMVPAPSIKELADHGTGTIIILMRIKGDKDARKTAQETLEKEIAEAFGADSDLVKNHRYDVVDHHGLVIAIPNIIAGIENVAEIASR